jgi:glycosyltransferase involved in cell wall biosynthesis
VPAPTGASRAQFGLPANRFHFLVMFDGNSWLSRKNPIAAVRAFKSAFGTERGVGLVIKAISLDRTSAAWQALEAELNGDDRVVVIDRTMGRVELTQLMASCDAYVSLHRSEGFGRIIGESMLLGLPTVTTNFSGNVDFCTPQTSFLVDGTLVALTPSDYIFHEGQYWCDPDVDQARQQMRRVFEQRDEARAVAQAARHNIQTHYSIEAVAAAYRSRLRELRTADLI